MAGMIRVRSVGARRLRAGLVFTSAWSPLNPGEVNEAQFLAILKDPELLLEGAEDEENPEWVRLSEEERAESAEELAKFLEFQSAEGAEDRTETGAPVSGASEAKDGTGTDDNAAPSVDPQGGEPASAVGSQESREGTEDGATAQEASSAGEKEPEQSLQAPVAEDVTEKTKPTGSHRRKA